MCLQGLSTEEQYLAVSGASKRLIEFTDGRIEILPMPTRRHQAISLHLLLHLLDAVRGAGQCRVLHRMSRPVRRSGTRRNGLRFGFREV